MSESFFYACAVIFALIGLYYVFDRLYRHFMCEKNCDGVYTVIYHFEDEEFLPDKVYSALLLTEYLPFGKREVYVIDRNFSHHIKVKCQLITANMGTVHFIRSEDLKGLYKIKRDND